MPYLLKEVIDDKNDEIVKRAIRLHSLHESVNGK